MIRVGDCIDPDAVPELDGGRCASASGVSLHANVGVPARDRKRLERLCRYVARPPVATGRLSRMADGRLLYRLKHRWRDGTTHVVFEPGELVEKLAARRHREARVTALEPGTLRLVPCGASGRFVPSAGESEVIRPSARRLLLPAARGRALGPMRVRARFLQTFARSGGGKP